MTTYSTTTTCDQSSNANFQAWVNEVYTGLVTQVGLTQTADTGQMAVPSVTAAPGAANQSVGYYVFRFNDTLQATVPIFFKLEFGSGGTAANNPMMFITVGTATDGAGNVTNPCTRVACCTSITGNSVTSFPSRWCYNTTQGFCGLSFKNGMSNTLNTQYCGLGGFFIFRTVDNTGAPTADGFHLLTNSNNATGTTIYAYMQIRNANTGAWMAAAGQTGQMPTNSWAALPWHTNLSMVAGTAQVFPVWQYKGSSTVPGTGITNATAIGIGNEIPIGSTITTTILGSTPLTYISTMGGLGTNTLTADPNSTNGLTCGFQAGGFTPYVTLLMLWQ